MQIDLTGYENEFLGGSDDKVLKKMKELLSFQPQYKPFLNTRVVNNIYDIYEKMVLTENYPVFVADKFTDKSVHFTRPTWTTINELTKRTGLPKVLVMTYAEACYILAKTGKIPISVIEPTKKEKGVIDWFKKSEKFARVMIPLATISAGLIALSYLTSQAKRFSYGK